MKDLLEFDGFSVRVCRTKRKTVALSVGLDGVVELRCGPRITEAELRAIVRKHESWIRKRLQAAPTLPPFTETELKAFAEAAKNTLPARVACFAALLGVTFGKITVRRQRTLWGSCSARGNLSFNCLLMAAPPQVRDYVVIHELCHRIHMDHSKDFWAKVALLCPDYKERRRWLRQHGRELIGRLP